MSREQVRTAEFFESTTSLFDRPNGPDGILMGCLELGIVFCFSLEIHLPEHVQCRFFPVITQPRAPLCF